MSRRVHGALIASMVVVGIVGAACTSGGGEASPSAGSASDGTEKLNVTLTEFRVTPGMIDAAAHLVTVAGGLALDEVQPEGKRRMAGSEWSKGVQLPARVDS